MNLYDADGKRKVKGINTGLEVRGNKYIARERLQELINEYSQNIVFTKVTKRKSSSESIIARNDMCKLPIVDYLHQWLETVKPNLQVITYDGCQVQIDGRIKDFFTQNPVKLEDLCVADINDFHRFVLAKGCTANTAIHYHALLRVALQYAVKKDIIPFNPCDKADRPKKNQFIAEYYSKGELMTLLKVAKDDPLYTVIVIAGYYGLRRSEVLGLKWSAVNFQEKKISICHKVVEQRVNGSYVPVGYDKMKTKSSHRTLPLIPAVAQALQEEKEK